ncbi:Calx-beta domain-containing protein [Ampullimonas aquatilis]|uniref:Calx-beta domain-containing protein n=1 Tax=Ampullimonas aquatilis TaxID=1341549 RepID=UPI003C74B590
MNTKIKLLAATVAALGLSACGGGGSSTPTPAPVQAVISSVAEFSPVVEGAYATAGVTFDKATISDAVITLTLADGSATLANGDYSSTIQYSLNGTDFVDVGADGKVTVPTGTTSVQVRVHALADNVVESDEAFTITVHLEGTAATNDVSRTITIQNSTVNAVLATAPNVSATEGQNADVVVTLDKASLNTATVTADLVNVATSAADYTLPLQVSFDGGTTFNAVSGSNITVPAGTTTFTVRLVTATDAVVEGDETATLTLTPDGTNIGAGALTSTITIQNTNLPVIQFVSSPSGAEGANIDSTVTLSATTVAASSVTLTLGGGTSTATATADYSNNLLVSKDNFATSTSVASGGTYAIPVGTANFKVRIAAASDTLVEGNETVKLTVAPVAGISGTSVVGTTTITDVLSAAWPVSTYLEFSATSFTSVSRPRISPSTSVHFNVAGVDTTLAGTSGAVTSTGGFSVFDSAAGDDRHALQLCPAPSAGTESDNLVLVDGTTPIASAVELVGLTFKSSADCAGTATETITFNNDGTATYTNGGAPSTIPAGAVGTAGTVLNDFGMDANRVPFAGNGKYFVYKNAGRIYFVEVLNDTGTPVNSYVRLWVQQ